MALDVKEKNLIKFIAKRLIPILAAFFSFGSYMELWDQPVRLLGYCLLAVWLIKILNRVLLFVRVKLAPRDPLSYGKWAIVTGATAGIGEAFAYELAARGMNVIIISRSPEKLEEVKKGILKDSPGVEVRCMAYDYTDRPGADAFFAKLSAECAHLDGGVGILVNNVGMVNGVPEYMHQLDDQTTYGILQVNVEGTVRTSRAIIPILVNQRKGAIINVSSGSGNHPTPMIATYCSTKSFGTQFSQCLSHELREFGVDVLVVTPYYVISNQFRRKKATYIAPTAQRMVQDTLPLLGYTDVAYPYWFHALCGFFVSIYWDVGGSIMTAMRRNRARIIEAAEAKKSKAKAN